MSDWIKWEGGSGIPVHRNTIVDVRFRDGKEVFGMPAGDYGWRQWSSIAEYRLSRFSGLEDAYDETDKPVSDSFQERALGTQVAGDHYLQFEIQPVTYINANNLDFLQGNVIKYITRHKLKGKKADVEKAIHFCKLILELQYGGE